MNFLSLFSGIGGLDLGLERAGMTCVGQVEIDPYARAVLAKHWPGVPRLDDVRAVRGDEFGPVDLVCGGVPCQPASCAGKRKGADDERWLWGEFVRIVRAVGPAWVLAENVRGFLSLPDSARVFDELEASGYEVGTVVLGAHHVGAPHKRDRVWIVAHAKQWGREISVQQLRDGRRQNCERETGGARSCSALADASGQGLEGGRRCSSGAESQQPVSASGGGTRWPSRPGEPQHEWEAPRLVDSRRNDRDRSRGQGGRGRRVCEAGGVGIAEPGVGVSVARFSRWLARFGLVRGRLLEAHNLVFTYGIPKEIRPEEIVCELRRQHGEADQSLGQTGGLGSIPSPEVLFEYLLRAEAVRTSQTGRDAGEGDVPLPRKEVSEASVRGVRHKEVAAGSPHRPGPQKQQAGEHPNALLTVSRLLAQCCEADWKRYCREDARALGLARRNDLKALGNAVVPDVAEVVGRAIMEAARA